MKLLRKQGLWLVIAMMAGILGGWLVYAGKAVAYTSTAQVDIDAHVIANTTPVVPNLATEKQVATSGVVVAATAQALGSTSLALANDLKAGASGTSNVLSISCTMPTAALAQRCASAAAASYVAFRNDAKGSPSAQLHAPLHATLVTPASVPQSPAGLGKKVLLPLGAILGLALGIGAIFLRDRMDDRVRDRADLERCLGAPVLAAVPRVPRRAGSPASVFSRAPLSPAAEAYRHLRVRLEPIIASASDQSAALLVASGGAGEGRTSVAANLAAALAHAGRTVLLVDADLRRPFLSTVFNTGERAGLTELLAGRASIEEVAIPTGVPGLRLVTVGRLTDRSADMFGTDHLKRAFARMRTRAEIVVVDSAPMGAISDAITLARMCDITVVVADLRRTHRADAVATVQDLRTAEPRAIVGVLNRAPRSSRGRHAWPSALGGPESLAPAASVTTTLAAVVPARGPNGKGRAPLGTLHGSGYGPHVTGSGAEGAPPSSLEPE